MPATDALEIIEQAQIPTWFGVGGRADRLARPRTLEQLRACLAIDPDLCVLGDGANLLVADEGVRELVVALDAGEFAAVAERQPTPAEGALRPGSVLLSAGAGVKLPRLITDTVRAGLAGLEGLGGIPASVGGAVMMNAGGQFGQTGDAVFAVHALDRSGRPRSFQRAQITFDYRRTLLGTDGPRGPAGAEQGLVVTRVDFRLRRAEPGPLRDKLKQVMDYKKQTQPMGERSAGCAFKNPVLAADLPGIAVAGSKVSAGLLIDRAGAKGLRIGGAQVSSVHANFITADANARAADVLAVMRAVRDKVRAAFGLTLEPEVKIWGASL